MRKSVNPLNLVKTKGGGTSPEEKQRARSSAQGSSVFVHLPTADQLEKYEEISPGAAYRILSMMEDEMGEKSDRIDLQRRRIVMTTSVSLLLIGAAGVGIWLEVFWPVILLFGLGGMATFLLSEVIRR
ncbi:MAG: DUF2335 domain-containing protein [Bacteroidetes bacterium]|nr:DUF2335 domain-containing protein [Bacteroidota bacterium]